MLIGCLEITANVSLLDTEWNACDVSLQNGESCQSKSITSWSSDSITLKKQSFSQIPEVFVAEPRVAVLCLARGKSQLQFMT